MAPKLSETDACCKADRSTIAYSSAREQLSYAFASASGIGEDFWVTGDERRKHRLTIRISQRLNQALAETAKVDERSKSNWIIFALKSVIGARERQGRASLLPVVLKSEPKVVPLTIRVPHSLTVALAHVAKEDGRSMSSWAALALDMMIVERRRGRP